VPSPDRTLLAAGAINAIVSIAAGAFGAHALRARLEPRPLEVFETAARYHMYHALGMVLCALAVAAGVKATGAGWVMQAGIAVFSGSLYALALTDVKVLGAITPIGGTLMMVGWGMLAWAALRG
jgi:uncharacterized membrane protein YgdD (TMEM256/DUF423 family)